MYFKKTVDWTNVYVHFYKDSYWDNTNGSGSSTDGNCVSTQQMTYDSSLGLYKYTYTGTYCEYISFTKDEQSNYGNFYNTQAVYRGDFLTSNPIFIPNSGGTTESKNGTTYYTQGQWVSTTTRTVYLATDWATPKAYCWNTYGEQFAWSGEAMTLVEGKTYDGHPIYSYTTKYDASSIKFSNDGDDATGDLTLTDGQLYYSGSWRTYEYDHIIKSGSTVVWDLADEDASYWPSTYMYRMHYVASAEFDAYSKLANNQRYKTYDADTYNAKFLFINNNTPTWTDYRFTTDITGDPCDVDGVTLFTYPKTTSYSDAHNKLDWQVTQNAKKATGGKKIYIDLTGGGTWNSSAHLKLGTGWFTRTIAGTKVTGTDKLYCITILNDTYYEKYVLTSTQGSNASSQSADGNYGYGYTGITNAAAHAGANRSAFQPYNISADSTLILSSGEGSSPKVWSVTKMEGHTHSVTITAPSHGTITVSYTDEDETTPEVTSGTFNVARTCVLTISAEGDTGYDLSTLTVNGVAHTSGNTYIIRDDITVAATFAAKTYTAADNLDKNSGDSHGQFTATYDATSIAINTTPVKTGYHVDGYYGESGLTNRVAEANGALNKSVTVSEVVYTDANNKWKKDGNVTLYTKWEANTYTITYNLNGGDNDEDNPASYTIESSTITLENPTKDGYRFDGWYDNSSFIGDPVTSIANGSTGNKEYWAKWTQIFTVSWSANGVSWNSHGTPSLVGYDGEKVADLPTAPTTMDCDDVKKFVGWTATADYSHATTAPSDLFTTAGGSPAIEGNTTFYAVFANVTAGSTVWTLTALNAVTAGTYAIMSDTYHAFNGTIKSGKGDTTTTAFSFTDGVASSAPDGTCELTFTASGDGFTIYNETTSKYLYAKAASAGNLDWQDSEDSYWAESSGNWQYSKAYDTKYAKLRYYHGATNVFNTYSNNTGVAITLAKKTTTPSSITNYATSCGTCTSAPTIVTPTVSDKTCDGATVTASVSSFGTGTGGCHIRNYGFVWSITTNPTIESHYGGDQYNVNENIDEDEEFSFDISGLKSGSHYYVRAYAENKYGVAYSEAQNIYTEGAEHIYITYSPRTTKYIVGGKIDTAGLLVRAHYYEEPYYQDVTKSCTFSPSLSTPLTALDGNITVSYTDACDSTHTKLVPITVRTLTVNEGTYADYGSFTQSADTIRVTLNSKKAFDFAISETDSKPDAEIISIGDNVYRVINPKQNVTVTINYRDAVQRKVYFKINNDTLKSLTRDVYEFTSSSSLPNASAVASAMSEDGVTLVAEAYPNFLGWVITPFYGKAAPPDFDESVYVTQDTALYAVFSNMQRVRIDESVITSGTYNESEQALTAGGITDGFKYYQMRKQTTDIQFKTDASNPGYLYNNTSLPKIRRIEIGAGSTGHDNVNVYASASAGATTTLLSDEDVSSYKYVYLFPENTSYFRIEGDNSYAYRVDYIDVYYNTSSVHEAYICRPRRTTPSGFWKDASHWIGGELPGASDVVYIEHSTGTYSSLTPTHAHVAAVVIRTDSAGSRLYIEPNSSLIVESSIREFDGSAFGPTTKEKLWINTSRDGNGALIVGNESDNTEAYYNFFTKTCKYGSYYVNQYVGIPFAEMEADQMYGFNIFVYADSVDDWRSPKSRTLEPWMTYNYLRQYSSSSGTFLLNGVLNLPGLDGKQTLNCGWRNSSDPKWNKDNPFPESIDGVEGHQDYMFANSWTAPISVEDLTSDDCVNLLEEVHIFNAGWTNPSAEAKKEIGDNAGQWTCISFEAAGYLTDSVIPSTQAFLVTATASGASLTLDYKKHVYDPAIREGRVSTYATRAPRRNKASNAPIKLKMIVRSDSVIADNIYLFQREDFTYDYDNGWDGTKMMGESFAPQLYAMSGERKLTIDAVPELDETEIGFKAGTQANEYTFSFEYDEQEEPLYLYDKDTQEFTEISNESTYTFTTSDRKAHNRFLLTRSNSPQIETGVEEIDTEKVKRAEKFMKDQQIFIRRGERTYSIDGSLVK